MAEPTQGRPIDILLVEPNPGDVRLTKEAFKDGRIRNDLHVVNNGQDALDYLEGQGEYEGRPRPDIVLLEINLPDMDGMDILTAIKESEKLETIPVIILSSSEAGEEIVRGYQLQANAYMTKPPDPDEFIQKIRTLANYWIQVVELPADCGL
ncbi:response regulator [Natronomonas salina]|uniref:response regulator n=1 Tax=Natronomonas salina TaxID=1710540 RepID=UPI0015B5D428|nr:response regulator [Natronomonas salina]QLD89174.1 response regulator [Natronomonas salina]